MTKDFIVSSPGKVILFGEHAVVHGSPAIAAAVSLRTYTLIKDSGDGSELTLDFADVGFYKTWTINDLPWDEMDKIALQTNACRVNSLEEISEKLNHHVVDILNEKCLGDVTDTFQHAAALAFLYLYMHLCSRDTPGRMFITKSTLPVGAGLGSSACFSVCLSAGLLRLGGHICSPSDKADESVTDLINAWSFLGECCIHGNPSGIDNAVATKGGAVLFQRFHTVVPISDFPVIRLVLTNTGVPRRTLEMVANVAKLKDRLPAVINPIITAIENVTREAHAALVEHESPVERLSPLVRINNALLVALGVSHPSLDKIRTVADSIGLGETKLTGAGGGGCAITLVTCSEEQEQEKVKQLRQQLPEGFEVFDTLLGGPGVGITEDCQGLPLDKFGKMDNSDFNKLQWGYWS
jgi:mevalonate kinase